MKSKMLITVIPCVLIIACGYGEKKNAISTQSPLNVVVNIYDITISTDSYAILTNVHIEQLYYGIGQYGGGKFYGLHIKTNSSKQDPITRAHLENT